MLENVNHCYCYEKIFVYYFEIVPDAAQWVGEGDNEGHNIVERGIE